MLDVRENGALFEHRFWLQILGDHARFIIQALPYSESQEIARAQRFISIFDELLRQARSANGSEDIRGLNQAAYSETIALRQFKLHLLTRQLSNTLTMSLPPTFFNHMLNELEEYVRILQALLAGRPVPVYAPLHHELLWLLDAAGHAGTFVMSFDRVEADLLQKSYAFERTFRDLYLKAVELAGFARTMLQSYPAMERFHRQVDWEMALFRKFLAEIEEMELSGEALDTISPLIPDHMGREECYFLLKLAQSGAVAAPDCDPTKPRVS